MLAGAAPSALGMLSAFRATRAHAQTQKPNILFILVDNLGYGELGVYGRGVTRGAPTPRIDKLTSKGLRLTNNPAFAGKTGNGDWADMDHNVGLILDAVDRLRIRDNTIVIFVSDNGPEFVRPWDGWAGPWRGQYFTAWEGGIRVPFMIRWPGKIPAGRVSDEIVHGVDMSRRLPASPALACRMTVPSTASINRTFSRARPKSQPARAFSFGAPGCRRQSGAISKCTFSKQETMVAPPIKLGIPLLFNLYENPREDEEKIFTQSWVAGPIFKMVAAFEESVKKHPLIAMGTPDPYTPPE